jgi:vacuolar protein sorting-associated protein 35
VERLFNAITPLLRDRDGYMPVTDEEGRELLPTSQFREEQGWVAKTIHILQNEDTDIQLKLYVTTRKYFAIPGTSNNRRAQFTLPPLVFAALNLSRRVFKRESSVNSPDEGEITAPQFSTRKVFQLVLELITNLTPVCSDPALSLFLQAAQVIIFSPILHILKYDI